MRMNTKITIAIDGHSACGKSTLAKDLAKELNYIYIDSGAMYRAVTLFLLQNNIPISSEYITPEILQKIHITFQQVNKKNHTFLNGTDVEDAIRSMEVSNVVSEVAAISAIRRFLVKQQQLLGEVKGIVMDGRDIGTVVFPDAELKLFMTASTEVRAQRRLKELTEKGKNTTLEQVKANLQHRDHIDSTREDSPLRKAEDAIVLDNSNLTPKEQIEIALGFVRRK